MGEGGIISARLGVGVSSASINFRGKLHLWIYWLNRSKFVFLPVRALLSVDCCMFLYTTMSFLYTKFGTLGGSASCFRQNWPKIHACFGTLRCRSRPANQFQGPCSGSCPSADTIWTVITSIFPVFEWICRKTWLPDPVVLSKIVGESQQNASVDTDRGLIIAV